MVKILIVMNRMIFLQFITKLNNQFEGSVNALLFMQTVNKHSAF